MSKTILYKLFGIGKLNRSMDSRQTLRVVFDAGDFSDERSGTVECRFKTPSAKSIFHRLSSIA